MKSQSFVLHHVKNLPVWNLGTVDNLQIRFSTNDRAFLSVIVRGLVVPLDHPKADADNLGSIPLRARMMLLLLKLRKRIFCPDGVPWEKDGKMYTPDCPNMSSCLSPSEEVSREWRKALVMITWLWIQWINQVTGEILPYPS